MSIFFQKVYSFLGVNRNLVILILRKMTQLEICTSTKRFIKTRQWQRNNILWWGGGFCAYFWVKQHPHCSSSDVPFYLQCTVLFQRMQDFKIEDKKQWMQSHSKILTTRIVLRSIIWTNKIYCLLTCYAILSVNIMYWLLNHFNMSVSLLTVHFEFMFIFICKFVTWINLHTGGGMYWCLNTNK